MNYALKGETMDLYELKKEQLKLAPRVVLRDNLTTIKTIGGASCVSLNNKLLACVVVCQYPSMKLMEKKTYLLADPLIYKQGYTAYREMPALIEAYNQLEQEPDILLINGAGILHPRMFGIACHMGLALNVPTIGIVQKLTFGNVQLGKIFFKNEVVGFEIKTREHANHLYASPGHLVSLGTVLRVLPSTIQYPHKLPEPLHLAHKIAKKKTKKLQTNVQ